MFNNANIFKIILTENQAVIKKFLSLFVYALQTYA